jgi:hypothetical protein
MRSVSPAARLAYVGVGVVALLAVVGLASRGDLGGGGGSGRGPSASLLDYGFSIFLVAYVLAIPFALWAFVLRQRHKRLAGGGGKGLGLLTNLAVFVALVGAALAIVAVRHARGEQQQRLKLPPPPTAQNGNQKPAAAREPQFQWSVVVVAAALGAAGVAAFLVVRRRRLPLREGAGLGEQLAFALDDAIDDVQAESDPRRAVIKAYARMEQILAAYGLPRAAAEAPFEYLARTLGLLHASAASVERLTDLFERAKFSLHEIGPELREEAILALTAVRDELRSPVEARAA